MSAWRRLALEKWPQYKLEIEMSNDVRDLWIFLNEKFIQAHYVPDPKLISEIYEYADWCLANEDLAQVTLLDFYESLPDDPKVREDMVHWLRWGDLEWLSRIWQYGRTEKEHTQLMQELTERKREGPKKTRREDKPKPGQIGYALTASSKNKRRGN